MRAGGSPRRFGSGSRWLWAALLLLGLAAWAPAVPQPGRDWRHLVVLDITQSMNTPDMAWGRAPASRLAWARQALTEALATLPCGSRLGLGVFSEYRSLMLLMPVEVCSHYHELRSVIARLDNRMSWAGASQVAKGLSGALKVLGQQAEPPTLLFVSDGHEAPPLRPGRAIDLGVERAKVGGLVLGVGGPEPVPIPKTDPEGHPLGVWAADEVLQADPISLGQTGEGAKQTLVDEAGRPMAVLRGSGQEHLSQLKEAHLQALAAAGGLGYRRLDAPQAMAAALRDGTLARWHTQPRPLREVPALLALGCLLMAFRPRRDG